MNVTNNSNNTNDVDFDQFFFGIGYIYTSALSLGLLFCILYKLCPKRGFECCRERYYHHHHHHHYHNNSTFNKNITIKVDALGEIEIPLREEYEAECAICLSKIKDNKIKDNKIYKLKCNHYFHLECWQKWENTENKTTCPLCRYGN